MKARTSSSGCLATLLPPVDAGSLVQAGVHAVRREDLGFHEGEREVIHQQGQQQADVPLGTLDAQVVEEGGEFTRVEPSSGGGQREGGLQAVEQVRYHGRILAVEPEAQEKPDVCTGGA